MEAESQMSYNWYMYSDKCSEENCMTCIIPQEIEAIKFLPTLKSDNLLMTFLITVQPSLYEVPD